MSYETAAKVEMMQTQREQAIRERAYAIWEHEGRPCDKDLDHWLRAEAEIISAVSGQESRIPQAWYAIVTTTQASLRSYFDHYRAMKDPALEPMPSEGPEFAKLSSTLFAGADRAEVQREAIRLVEIITGAAKIEQDPGNLHLHSVVAVYADGETERFRRTDLRISLGRPYVVLKNEGEIKETFEKSVVLFALQCDNPYVNEVLRLFAQSDDWSGLYRILETISLDLNKNDPERKKDARDKMVRRGWVSQLEMDSFETTLDSRRHRRSTRPSAPMMSLPEAQNLMGRIIKAWLQEIAKRRAPYEQPSRFDTAIGAEQPIPEEIDHREVAVPVAVVDEMKFLLSTEPRKAAKPRSRNMILTVDVVMPTE